MGDGRPGRRTVRELLTDAKDAAELMIDLAYAAVFFGDESLAREVQRLERELGDRLGDLREVSILAARTPDDAAGLSGVLALASAIEDIADSAVDIATITVRKLGVPPELRADLRHAAEVVTRFKVAEGSALSGLALHEAELPSRTGMWIIAVRRGDEFHYGPDGHFSVQAGDVLLLQGPERGIGLAAELAGAEPPSQAQANGQPPITNLDRAVDLCIELKNASEVAVGLAYSAILLRDPGLASEVAALETRTDRLWEDLESWALEAASEVQPPQQLRGLFHIAAASERIADAARGMTRIIESEEPPHPIIAQALGEAGEVVADAMVAAGSEAAGRSLADLQLQTSTGMEVLAIQRDHRWLYRPRGRSELRPGDRLLAMGPEEGIAHMRELCGDDRSADDVEARVEAPEDDHAHRR